MGLAVEDQTVVQDQDLLEETGEKKAECIQEKGKERGKTKIKKIKEKVEREVEVEIEADLLQEDDKEYFLDIMSKFLKYFFMCKSLLTIFSQTIYYFIMCKPENYSQTLPPHMSPMER